MTKTVKDATLPSLARKQQPIAISGAVCSPGRALAWGAFDVLPRTQRAHRDQNGACLHSCRLRSSSEGAAGPRATF
eukprot:3893908-Alexandrium_andersonii.AAC.1